MSITGSVPLPTGPVGRTGVALLVMTDGRKHIIDAIRSAEANLLGPITHRLIHDDSGIDKHRAWLHRTFPDYKLIGSGERVGFSAAYARAWREVATLPVEWVFSTEDDFTFNRPVPLPAMAAVLARRPELVQLALRRQPWNDEERAAGGVVERFPGQWVDCHDGFHDWLESRTNWTTNPSLHSREVCDLGWPDVPESEGHFSRVLLASPEVRFGYWGTRDSGQWVEHIGRTRIGVGY